jgi:hypothetical protein
MLSQFPLRFACWITGEEFASVSQCSVKSKERIRIRAWALTLPMATIMFSMNLLGYTVDPNAWPLFASASIAMAGIFRYLDREILTLPQGAKAKSLYAVRVALVLVSTGLLTTSIDTNIFRGQIAEKMTQQQIESKKLLTESEQGKAELDRTMSIKRAQDLLDRKSQECTKLNTAFVNEGLGKNIGGTGFGTIANTIKTQADACRTDEKDLRIALIQIESRALPSVPSSTYDSLKNYDKQFDNHLKAFWTVFTEENSVKGFWILVFIFGLLIETAPLQRHRKEQEEGLTEYEVRKDLEDEKERKLLLPDPTRIYHDKNVRG